MFVCQIDSIVRNLENSCNFAWKRHGFSLVQAVLVEAYVKQGAAISTSKGQFKVKSESYWENICKLYFYCILFIRACFIIYLL